MRCPIWGIVSWEKGNKLHTATPVTCPVSWTQYASVTHGLWSPADPIQLKSAAFEVEARCCKRSSYQYCLDWMEGEIASSGRDVYYKGKLVAGWPCLHAYMLWQFWSHFLFSASSVLGGVESMLMAVIIAISIQKPLIAFDWHKCYMVLYYIELTLGLIEIVTGCNFKVIFYISCCFSWITFLESEIPKRTWNVPHNMYYKILYRYGILLINLNQSKIKLGICASEKLRNVSTFIFLYVDGWKALYIIIILAEEVEIQHRRHPTYPISLFSL